MLATLIPCTFSEIYLYRKIFPSMCSETVKVNEWSSLLADASLGHKVNHRRSNGNAV